MWPSWAKNNFHGDFDHKIVSMVILPILLIQEGQLSVTVFTICIRTDRPEQTV